MARAVKILATLLGLLMDLLGITSIPDQLAAWGEWLEKLKPYTDNGYLRIGLILAGLLLIYLANRKSWAFSRESNGLKPQQYITVCEAIEYIINDSKWGRKEKELGDIFGEAAGAMRQAALNGDIEVRGRLENSSEYELIDRHYWETGEFALIDCMNPDVRDARSRSRSAYDHFVPEYVGLRVDRRQIGLVWPRAPLWSRRPDRPRVLFIH